MDDEPTITLLEALKAELADYERRRARAAARQTGDYGALLVAGWDHAIGVKKAQIEREQERATTIQP